MRIDARHAQKHHYVFVEGMENLLMKLHSMDIEMHAFSNYSNWYR